MGGFAWVTLATNDSYSLGALVLGHSLRKAGTPHDLVVLVTPGVSSSMRSQLASVFTLVQEVNVLDSRDEAHLALMSRPELGITFTKLHCWRLTQYEKCVFLDADTLVIKNSDELFEREELSAAPDPGWPDCFNSGVFVYRPSEETFNSLLKFALSKGSFDGGDQGLLNMFFSDWATKDISRHLPFIYNMVSSASYSYLPAYKQFGEGVKIAHFIGGTKPWLQYFDSETRLVRTPPGTEHLQPLLQLWWDIFCSTVHPSLSTEMLGLAGALAQLTLGAPRSAEQTALEEHLRKQAWEHGNMDYMGRDSFDNIWRKISETLAQAPPKPEAEKPSEQVPPKKSASEPKLPESELPESKSRQSLPADTGEKSGLPGSTSEPAQDSKPTPLAPVTLPDSDQAKPAPVVPRTPLVTEATPPTSPIITPTAPLPDIQALKVDASLPETPPVGSVTSDLVSPTVAGPSEVPQDTKPCQSSVIVVASGDSVCTDGKSSDTPTTDISSVKEVPNKEVTVSSVQLTESKEIILSPTGTTEITSPVSQISHPSATEVKSLPENKIPVPGTEISVPETSNIKPHLEEEVPSPKALIESSEIKPVSSSEKEVLTQSFKTEAVIFGNSEVESAAGKEVLVPESKILAKEEVPVSKVPGTLISKAEILVSEAKPTAEKVPSHHSSAETSDKVPIASEIKSGKGTEKDATVSATDIADSASSKVQPTDRTGVSMLPPPITVAQEAVVPTMTVEASTVPPVEKSIPKELKQSPVPAAPSSKSKEEVLKRRSSKTEDKKLTVESNEPSGQSKSEELPKTSPVKSSGPVSPPTTPDAPPSDQAPIPPKRRGHKGPGTGSTEQGATGKQTQPQSQQAKGSKSAQKGKK